jgi:preprotein translocase subunit YajC
MQNPTGLSFFVTMLLIMVVVYFLLMRPQSKQQKERQAMLKQVKKGDRIVTTSGMFGTVVGTKGDDVLIVKIADNVRVEMARPAVASVVSAEQAKAVGTSASPEEIEGS